MSISDLSYSSKSYQLFGRKAYYMYKTLHQKFHFKTNRCHIWLECNLELKGTGCKGKGKESVKGARSKKHAPLTDAQYWGEGNLRFLQGNGKSSRGAPHLYVLQPTVNHFIFWKKNTNPGTHSPKKNIFPDATSHVVRSVWICVKGFISTLWINHKLLVD